jgi:histone acetyltransferase (RNA polymerase elongator complex component)
MTRHYIIPIFVPHFGCPHDCVFCNQRKITGLSTDVTVEEVRRIIDEHLATFKKDSFIEVAFYGGSFTAIKKEIQMELLKVPYEYKKEEKIHNIRLSTRPDAIDDDILGLLKDFKVDTIELGVQSLDNEVLKMSERGHSDMDVYESTRLIRKWGFKLGHQIMLGLPGDSRKKSLDTAKSILEMNPDMIRIYPTLVIKNTALEDQMNEGSYTPLSLDEAVETSAMILMAFTSRNIPVIRVGLQPTENIQMGKDVVAGPFHPSFRQLVEEYVFRLLFNEYVTRNRIETKGKVLVFQCSNTKTSIIAGQHGRNRERLIDDYGFKKVKIIPSIKKDNKVKIVIDNEERVIDLDEEIKLYVNNNPI